MIPRQLALTDLGAEFPGNLVAWVTPSAQERFAYLPSAPIGALPPSADVLLAIGGGSIIDQAKWAAKGASATIPIIALPTIWGSGAEASPIVVLTSAAGKKIHVGEHLLPDARILVNGITDTASPDLLRWASADVWAHALEGFLSPLADGETRTQLAAVMTELTRMDPTTAFEGEWFGQSAAACSLQAQASVGLAHGIAHQIEAVSGFGHARVIAAALPVVLEMHSDTDRYAELLAEYGLSADAIHSAIHHLASDDDMDIIRPLVASHWQQILRDPCTRTNGFLVRRHAVEYFS
jgi:1-propanol dehydrogenase